MEKQDEFVYNFFNLVSQSCFEKAKEHVEKEKEGQKISQTLTWIWFMSQLSHVALAEKSYSEIGFLQIKNKSFLRKDNSLKSVYESLKQDMKRLEDASSQDRPVINYCQNIIQLLDARINLMDFYEKVYLTGVAKHLRFNENLIQIENLIQRHSLGFADISMAPLKAIFNMECEILEQLFKALTELQRLQFLPSLALIHGAHTRLTAWENKIQNKETWKLGFLKNNPTPALYQWLLKFKGAVLSKFSIYFHDTLAQHTNHNEMKQHSSKLQYDYYQKIVSFQRKYDAISVLLLSDNQVSCDVTNYENFPVITCYPPRITPDVKMILKMIADCGEELLIPDRIIFKYSIQEHCTYILATVEANIYLVLIFENKKSDKDVFINTFVNDICCNARCSKLFVSLKTPTK